MLSFWEKQTWFNKLDLVVVGGGLVGLCTAIYYKNRFPDAKVLVLERSAIGFGASTRNAGFACYGSPSELLDDLQTESLDSVLARVEQRYLGFRQLLELLGPEALGYEPLGGRELFRNGAIDGGEMVHDRLSALNSDLKSIFGQAPFESEKLIPERLGLSGFKSSISLKFEGQIDTGKTMYHLIKLARSKGIELINGLKVVAYEDQGTGVWIETDAGRILSRHLALCTNGFARELIENSSVYPARAQVLISAPISNLGLKGIFHVHKGYYYFRNVGDRILLGGGRHQFRKAENTARMLTTAQVQRHLERFLKKHLHAGRAVEIQDSWAGVMGFGAQNEKGVLIRKISPRIACGVRLGGMGIAIGASVGKQTADLFEH